MNRQYLTALVYFEKAASLQSFTQAANQTFVTRSAISHRIRWLEDYLNVTLFHRSTRQITLTDEGNNLLVKTQQAFDLLRKAELSNRKVIRLSLGSYLSSHWLMPRLSKFEERHPQIKINLLHQSGIPNSIDYDIAIAWVPRDKKLKNSVALFDAPAFPVIAPELLKKNKLEKPFWKRSLPAIHYQSRKSWKQWLVAAGASEEYSKTGDIFMDPNLVIDAAIHGRGVALGFHPFISVQINQNKLVSAHDSSLPLEHHYRLIVQHPNVSFINEFKQWLITQANIN